MRNSLNERIFRKDVEASSHTQLATRVAALEVCEMERRMKQLQFAELIDGVKQQMQVIHQQLRQIMESEDERLKPFCVASPTHKKAGAGSPPSLAFTPPPVKAFDKSQLDLELMRTRFASLEDSVHDLKADLTDLCDGHGPGPLAQEGDIRSVKLFGSPFFRQATRRPLAAVPAGLASIASCKVAEAQAARPQSHSPKPEWPSSPHQPPLISSPMWKWQSSLPAPRWILGRASSPTCAEVPHTTPHADLQGASVFGASQRFGCGFGVSPPQDLRMGSRSPQRCAASMGGTTALFPTLQHRPSRLGSPPHLRVVP